MSCPKCASPAVRVTEPGFAKTHMICMKCGHAYERTSPSVKSLAAHSILLALPAVLSAILAPDMSDMEF